MKNKGFTLIELLAVIVILAVVALIAYPVITGIVENSKKNSALRSIEGYVEAANNATVIYDVDNSKGINVTTDKHTFTSDEDILDFSKIKVKGTIPTYSYIDFNTKTKAVKEGHFCISGYSVIYENNQAKISNTNYCTDNHDSGDNEEIGNGGNQGNDDPEPIVEEDPKELVLYEEGSFNLVSGVNFSTWGTQDGWKPKAWIDSTSSPGHTTLRLESSSDSGARLTAKNAVDMSKYTRFCVQAFYQRYSSGGSAGWISLSTQPYHDVGRITWMDIKTGSGNGNFITKLPYSYNGNLYFIISSSGNSAIAITKIWLERD